MHLFDVLRGDDDASEVVLEGQHLVRVNGILRQQQLLSAAQAQTADTFGFKWRQRHTFESPEFLEFQREWLVEKYGDPATAAWWEDYGPEPVLLDAGCGASLSAIELFGTRLSTVRYIGVDVSEAVDVAADRFAERGLDAAFLQADLATLPIPAESVDVIFSEGVIHHTDDPAATLKTLSTLLVSGGRILFYVYKRKGPIREFSDDYVRERLEGLAPEEAWDAVGSLTRLGKALGDLGVTVEVPEDVELLEIPAGPIDLQRLFYWHVCKLYYQPQMTLDEMNHVNFDWFAPKNAWRQTPDEVRRWCADAGLVVEREHVQDSGITVTARREP